MMLLSNYVGFGDVGAIQHRGIVQTPKDSAIQKCPNPESEMQIYKHFVEHVPAGNSTKDHEIEKSKQPGARKKAGNRGCRNPGMQGCWLQGCDHPGIQLCRDPKMK